MPARLCLTFAVVLLLSACGSSPPTDFYALQPLPASSVQTQPGASVLGVGPLEMPAYLNRPQLVTQGPGSELEVDEFHRWAEPLERALPRVIAGNVDSLVDSLVVVGFPWDPKIRADYRLLGRISRFSADTAGLAVLEVQWSVLAREGETVIAVRRDRYQAQARSAGNPGDVVSALNETVDAYSRDIANRMQAVGR